MFSYQKWEGIYDIRILITCMCNWTENFYTVILSSCMFYSHKYLKVRITKMYFLFQTNKDLALVYYSSILTRNVMICCKLRQLKLLLTAAQVLLTSLTCICVWFCQFLCLLEGTNLFKLLGKDNLQSWLPQRWENNKKLHPCLLVNL